ncbi:Rab-3A-interacting protein [Nymphon striatum]|nr:Rab-3A-interacting protein [Nymphon striatum]
MNGSCPPTLSAMPALNQKSDPRQRSATLPSPQCNGSNNIGLTTASGCNQAKTDSEKSNSKARGHSVRSSSDGAVYAMEGSCEEPVNALYRTVSESDKNDREKKNEILMESLVLDSETDTEGPDSPQSGAVLQLNGNVEVLSPEGTIDSVDLYTFHCDGSPGIVCEINGDAPKQRTVSVAEVKEIAYARLQEELLKAQHELKLKDEEVEKLRGIREEVSAELEDLTASLFQEAHNMVRVANVKHATAQKHVKEANLKIEVLQAEVQALKTLVITSTPSMPNPKLHPQIDSKVDPISHKEFISWKESPELDKSHAFLARIYEEDISPCMNFPNAELAAEVLKSVENNTLIIEAVSGKNPFPKKCLLLDTPRLCKYKMKLSNSDTWYHISQLCRNRIAAVCELMCYFRYIKQGLVRSPVNDVYWEVMRRRKEITLARLGMKSST